MRKQQENKFVILGDVTAMFTTSGEMFLISTEDLPRVRPYLWHIGNVSKKGAKPHRYVTTNMILPQGRRPVCMQRFLKGTKGKQRADHINGNTLDNTQGNLRVTTAAGNAQNRLGANRNNKLGIRGVTYNERYKKPFLATVKAEGKQITERYATVEEAAAAVIQMRLRYMPHSAADHKLMELAEAV